MTASDANMALGYQLTYRDALETLGFQEFANGVGTLIEVLRRIIVVIEHRHMPPAH